MYQQMGHFYSVISLSPAKKLAMVWTNGGLLPIERLGINLRNMWIKIQTFLFKKIDLKLRQIDTVANVRRCNFSNYLEWSNLK